MIWVYFVAIAAVIIFLLSGQTGSEISKISEEDIRDMIRVGEQEGIIKSEEREILYSVFDFARIRKNAPVLCIV